MDWTLPREIYDFCAVKTDDDKIMVIGGNEYPEKEARIFDSTTVDIFDPVTKMWSNGPAMSKRRATHDCIVTEYNGKYRPGQPNWEFGHFPTTMILCKINFG